MSGEAVCTGFFFHPILPVVNVIVQSLAYSMSAIGAVGV
jgi:hypothetical protein